MALRERRWTHEIKQFNRIIFVNSSRNICSGGDEKFPAPLTVGSLSRQCLTFCEVIRGVGVGGSSLSFLPKQ